MAPRTTFYPICHHRRFCVCETSRLGIGKASILRILATFSYIDEYTGYSAPQNLQNYALYLDSRIKAYKDLKHDAVRVQADTNRDMRNSQSIEEEGYRGRKDRATKPIASAPARSKTIMGRKLRSMTVEKGLLRETKAVHHMIDTLVECRVRSFRSLPCQVSHITLGYSFTWTI